MSVTFVRTAIYAACLTTALLCSVGAGDDRQPGETMNLRLTLKHAEAGALVPGRITVEQRPDGGASIYHFVKSLDPAGSAVTYDVARSEASFEKHTTVSAHPFGASVPPGIYIVSYEHGPEWCGSKATLQVTDGEVTEQELTITRWIDMNARGWYPGDTHVHRSLEELPNVMRAEELNVALPLSYWVRDAYSPPVLSNLETEDVKIEPRLITVDPNRVIWPINTEYELFTLNGQRHTQGAVFVLGHQQPLTLPAPPVAPIADEARRQGALLDLDKHSWPWSLMLVPIMDVDLFELSNNHIWRTEFFFKQWTKEMRPEGWNIETDADGFTEWGWIDFGFKTYYALLNCGFKMRPTAGTASGVHPVPLGFGRVYVECPDGFSYEKWMQSLDAGRSFVTTGPMLFATVNGQPPGSTITADGPTSVRVQGSVENYGILHRIEIVRNGHVVDLVERLSERASPNVPEVRRASFDVEVPIDTTSWIAVRCFGGRTDDPTAFRFAHSSPVHIDMPGKPLRPRKFETDYFITRMEQEIARNKGVLRPDELAEYERALAIYREIAETGVDESPAPPTDEQLLSLAIPPAELPDGWKLTDISEINLEVLGANPVILSHPALVRALTAHRRQIEVDDQCNVLRSLLAFYSNAASNRSAVLFAHVCADHASAEYAAQHPKSMIDRHTRFRTWVRGDLAVQFSMNEDTPDAEFEMFATMIESRLPKK